MKLKLPVAITSKAGHSSIILKKNSPKILFGLGIVGFAATTVTACRATLHLEEILDENKKNVEIAKELREKSHPDYSENDFNKDLGYIYARSLVSVAKLYAPSLALGAVSVASLTSSHNILNKRNASLTAAYVGVDKAFSEYRARVIEQLGEDKDRDFRYETEKVSVEETNTKGETKKVKKNQPTRSNDKSMYARFFDELNANWCSNPEYNLIFLRAQQNYANDKLVARGHLFLNDVYDMLGIDRTSAGAVVGWVAGGDGDNFVDFGIYDGDNYKARDFVNGREGAILLDFNVDGIVYDKIDKI